MGSLIKVLPLILFLSLEIGVTASAQCLSKWSFGLHAGLNSSWLSSSNQNSSPGFSPSVGLQLHVPLKGNWSFQTEANYFLAKPSISAVRQSNTGVIIQEFKALFHIHYFDLPVFINYTLFNKNNWRLVSGLGCSFKYGFNSKVDAQTKVGQPPSQILYSGPSIGLSNETDFILISPSIQVSVAHKFHDNKEITLCLRYSMSLQDPLPYRPSTREELAYDYGVTFSESKLQSLTLFIAYQFGFK